MAKLTFEYQDRPNRHALYDLGQAVANLIVQATALGLFVHQMAGFSQDKARAEFGIPAGYDPVTAITVGYDGDVTTLPEDLQEREHAARARRPLAEFAFGGQWGQVAGMVGNGVSRSRRQLAGE